MTLLTVYNNISGLTEPQKQYLHQKVNERWDFIYGDTHGVGYLFYLRYCNAPISTLSETAMNKSMTRSDPKKQLPEPLAKRISSLIPTAICGKELVE
jgi:hypothetical protein